MLVYLITNVANGKYYVGRTKGDLSARWQGHLYASKTSKFRLYWAFKKYGLESFKIEILSELNSIPDLVLIEQLWILSLRSFDPEVGYNMTFGGEGFGYGAFPESERKKIGRKISAALLGVPLSEQHKKRMSECRMGNSNLAWKGKTVEEILGPERGAEARRKNREGHKGFKFPTGVEFEEKRIAGIKRVKEKKSAIMKMDWKINREKRIKALKASFTPEVRKRQSETMKKIWAQRKANV